MAFAETLVRPTTVHANELRVCKAANKGGAVLALLNFSADIKRCYKVNRVWRRESPRAAISLSSQPRRAFQFQPLRTQELFC